MLLTIPHHGMKTIIELKCHGGDHSKQPPAATRRTHDPHHPPHSTGAHWFTARLERRTSPVPRPAPEGRKLRLRRGPPARKSGTCSLWMRRPGVWPTRVTRARKGPRSVTSFVRTGRAGRRGRRDLTTGSVSRPARSVRSPQRYR